MAIQVRRGNESDFNASKMLPGEWAVSLDTKYVRMCFAPGVVLRMATYEGFEADKAQIQAILAECRNIQYAVQRIQAEVNSKASLVVEYSNNAKASADKAHSEAERAKIYADNAEAVTGVQIATKERAGLIKGGDNHIAEDGTLMLITTTTSTTQPNSYAGRENILEIGGVTEQDSTAGNQLFDKNTISSNVGISTTSGSLYSDTTMFSTNYIDVSKFASISWNGKSSPTGVWGAFYDASKKFVGAINKNGTSTFTIDIPSGASYVRLSFLNEYLNTAMVNGGNTVLPYEPYTGGIPAPNPSYPMEIKKSVVIGVKTHGKNLLKVTMPTTPLSSVVATNNGDGTYSLNGTATVQPWFVIGTVSLKANKKYRVCGTPKNVTACGIYVEGVDSPRDSGNGFIYVPSVDVVKKIYISVGIGEVITNALFKPMVTEDLEATYDDFEPYQGTEITFSQPIELYGIGDVQDVIEDGKIKRRFTKAVFDGTEGWVRQATGQFYLPLDTLVKKGLDYYYNSILCDRYKVIPSHSHTLMEGICGYYDSSNNYPNSNWLYIINPSIDTREDFIASLQANPITVVYELRTPTTEALPIADQIGLNSLATYDGITYVEFDSEIQPTFKAEYGTSKVGGYTLESLLTARNNELKQNMVNERLSALEASVVNNI